MIQTYINLIESRNNSKLYLSIDDIRNKLFKITDFFSVINYSNISRIPELSYNDTPKSEFYNNFLTSIQSDVNNIYNIQQEIKNNIITSWNEVETEITQDKTETIYDYNVDTEYSKCRVIGEYILPAITNEESIKAQSNVPIIYSETNLDAVKPFYGKQYGEYIKDNELSEDGIRICDLETCFNDNNFFEVEAVIIDKERENTKLFQSVITTPLTLKTNIKFIFKTPVIANTFKIKPMNFSSNVYFHLDEVLISDGINTYSIPLYTNVITDETIITFQIPDNFINKKMRSITFYLSQNQSYQEKYSLAYYTLNNNAKWLDITGPHVLKYAQLNKENLDEGISYVIENASQWIADYWLPGVKHNENPELDPTKGNNGYLTVATNESTRKRYAIGISALDISNSSYENYSEIITTPIKIENETNIVELEMENEGEVYAFISSDKGVTWNRINKIGSKIEYDEKYKEIPSKIYINSDLSIKRKEASDTGLNGYINNSDGELRVRFVLKYSENNIPLIKSWKLKFSQDYME